jgi:hypothetical protein
VGLIILQAVWVGLNHLAGLQEQQSRFVGGHPRNKGLGVVKSGSEPRGDDLRIRRFRGSQRTPFLRRVMSGSTACCRRRNFPDRGAKRATGGFRFGF